MREKKLRKGVGARKSNDRSRDENQRSAAGVWGEKGERKSEEKRVAQAARAAELEWSGGEIRLDV